MLIRFSAMTASRRVLPVDRVERGIGWCRHLAANPKQGSEGVERREAAVKADGSVE